jgi:hypothetical protein
MLVVADAEARSSPHPPLPCRRIIFTVLDHAASGAGGRRPQKEPGVEQGQPNFTLPQTSHLPKFPALPVVPALELPRQWRLWTRTPNPSTSCSTFSSCFRHKGPGSHRGAPVAQAAFAPIQHRIPSLKNKVFFAHLRGMSWSWKVARVALDVDSAQAGWYLLM